MVEWSRLVGSVPKVDVVRKNAVTLGLRGVGVVMVVPSGECVAKDGRQRTEQCHTEHEVLVPWRSGRHEHGKPSAISHQRIFLRS